MSATETQLNRLRAKLESWSQESGFRNQAIDFTPGDIIYGRRISMILSQHGCCRGVSESIDDIRTEAEKDRRFAAWLEKIPIDRLQTLCEFLLYDRPPKTPAA